MKSIYDYLNVQYESDDGLYRNYNWKSEVLEHDNPIDILHEITGFCGCGVPRKAISFLYNVLKRMRVEESQKELDTLLVKERSDVYYFILYSLEVMGWTTHGFSIPGSRPSKKGEEFISMYEEVLLYEDMSFAEQQAKEDSEYNLRFVNKKSE